MVFSSSIFVFAFLPIVLAVYYAAQRKYQNGILLLASLMFYAYGEPKFVFVMLASIVLNYLFALLLGRTEKKRSRLLVLWGAVVVNMGLLFVYKYLGLTQDILNRLAGHERFTWAVPALPIGISFFTFQALSYVIDVYYRHVPVQKNPFYVALYISFFPQLIAGPIVRYNTIAEQIEHRTVTWEKFSDGVHRFILGFGKKVIIANNVAVIAREAFADPQQDSLLMLWLGALAFTLQIFFDFGGYSDMAIGLGKMFGFTFEENFNYPYISGSITEFWRRWHMSLSQWFRDYVYIPLGGSRVGKVRNILNLFLVWLLTGIWHGANYTFIVWGLLQFVVQLVEKVLIHPEKRRFFLLRGAWRLVTLLTIVLGWVVFNSASLSQAGAYIASMFGAGALSLADNQALHLWREYGAYMVMGIAFSTPVAKVCGQKLQARFPARRTLLFNLRTAGELFIFLWAASFVLLGSYNPFIYFNF